MKKILVPTSGTVAAAEAAEYAMQIAKAINADVHVLHIVSEEADIEQMDDSLRLFELASEAFGVHVVGRVGTGNIAEQIVKYADENDINLVLMGASNGRVVEKWLSYEVLGHTSVPVLVMPYQVFEFSQTEVTFVRGAKSNHVKHVKN